MRPKGAGMDDADQQHVFEELKKEHMRAMKECDVKALQRVQEKLDKLTRREREHQ